ncbi:MAG: hypothetical protein U5K00_07720 [Melioribacteraceae bacterium]|nr:hypothetical protein [Melioribacteraceae bacterium]
MSETYGDNFLVSPLLSIRYEMARTIISYTYKYLDHLYGVPISINRPIEIDMRGKNRWTLGLGLTVEYSFLNLTLGYKFAATPTIRGGISFNI